MPLRSDQVEAIQEVYTRAHEQKAWPKLDEMQRDLAAQRRTLNLGRAIEDLEHNYVRLDQGFSGEIELTLRAIYEVIGPDAPELQDFWSLVVFCRGRYADQDKPLTIPMPEMMALFGNDSDRWQRVHLLFRSASWFLRENGPFEWQIDRNIVEFDGAHDIGQFIRAEAELRASIHGRYADPTVEAPTPSSAPVSELWRRPLPSDTDPEITARLRRAQEHFERPGATAADQRDAVRNLTDVLELLRPRIGAALGSKDEDALFEIINKFGIRHANRLQRDDYDPLWLFWMFHVFGATIYVVLWRLADLGRLSEADSQKPEGSETKTVPSEPAMRVD